MLKRDDPQTYRHKSNANPGQCNSPLTTTADSWTQGRIRVRRTGPLAFLTPEVFVLEGSGTRSPETAVPQKEGSWQPITNGKTGRTGAFDRPGRTRSRREDAPRAGACDLEGALPRARHHARDR